MADFDDLIEAQLRGATVRVAPLVHFGFKSGPVRLWPGFGDLAAGGQTWRGIGEAGQISAITTGYGQEAEEVTFTLFGSEGLLANLAADAEESSGRDVQVWLQFFDLRQTDEAGRWVDWQTLSAPLAWFPGKMGPLTATRSPPSGDSPALRIVSVTAVNAFSNRNRPRNSYFSDLDQKARSPGDNFFSRISAYTKTTVPWPKFSI